MRRRVFWFSGLLAFSASSSGCKCEHEEEHPYTPFGVASVIATSEPAASTTTLEAGAPPPFVVSDAKLLEPPAAHFDGFTLPEGWLARHFIRADFSSHHEGEEVVAWLVPAQPDHTTSPGELWFLQSGQAPRRVMDFPAFVPTGPECRHQLSLRHTGPRSVTVDLAARCESKIIARAPTRAVEVLRPEREQPRLLALRLATPPPDDELVVEVASGDADQDRHDDVEVTFTLARKGSSTESSAQFLWLDRAAGPARDPSEPSKSFTDIGSIEMVRAKGKKTSSLVPERIDNARRLFAYVCEESGTYGVSDGEGAPLACGELTRAFDWYVQAEVQAELVQERWGRALLALQRGDWYGAPREPKLRDELAELIRSKVSPTDSTLTLLEVRPLGSGSLPRRSPLAFDTEGRLLIQTAAGIVRLDTPDGEVLDASEEVDAWQLIPFGRRREKVTGLSLPCDESQVTVLASLPDGRLESVFVTDLLSPRPGACGSSLSVDLPELRIIGFAGGELSGFVGPVAFGTLPRTIPMGTPVSPNGLASVSATELGLLVTLGSDAELWNVGSDAPLSECVIDDGASRAACISDQHVAVIRRTAARPPTVNPPHTPEVRSVSTSDGKLNPAPQAPTSPPTSGSDGARAPEVRAVEDAPGTPAPGTPAPGTPPSGTPQGTATP